MTLCNLHQWYTSIALFSANQNSLSNFFFDVYLFIINVRLKWREVIAPAIKLAKEGFKVTPHTGKF